MFILTKTKKRTIQLLYTTTLLLFLTTPVFAQNWAPVGASTNGISPSWGSFQNLVGDQAGNLYCSFYDGSVTKGSVMKYDGSTWSYLGGAGITPGTATYSSLALAGNGNVFYSHQLGWPASGISVQKFDGTSWTTLPSAESNTVNFQSITSNGSNQPVVAYSSGGALKVKSFDGTNWSVLGTGLPAVTPYYVDAKCVNDTVYVGFANSGMKVYKIPASASATDLWIEVGTTNFPATDSEQFRSAIAVDNNNDVFAAFTSLSAGGNKLNVKKYDHATGQWSDVGTANFTEYRVHYVDIALDNIHTPYVAFSNFENAPNNRNFVMKFDGTNWITIGDSDVSGSEAKWNSLVISNNQPIVAYSDESNDAVMVKEFSTDPCAPVSSFYENFDAPALTCCNMGVVPECWNSISTATGANQIISNTTPASGTNNIYQFGYGPGKISIVVAREVNNINAGTHQFRFKLRANSGPGNLDFGYITDITDASTFVTLQTIDVTNTSYNDPIAERTFAIPNTVPSNARLAIRNPGTSWAGFYWDDVYWEPIVSTPVQSIDVTTQNNVPATITTNAGNLQMMATILPATANQNVTWSIVPASGNATISSTGLVTAQSNGTVWAKAVSVENAAVKDSLEITISGQVVFITSLDVQTQNNVAAVITTNAGTLQTIAVITPVNTTNQDVTWSIVNGTGSATISATGLVTAQTNGTVWAKAVSVENATVKDSLEITISGQPVSIVSLDVQTQNNVSPLIFTSNGTLQVVAVSTPANTSNQNVTWSIVNGTGTATISATGLVTAQTNGTVWAKAVSLENATVKDSLLITISGQSSVGINDLFAGSVVCYPNPLKGQLTVEISLFEGTEVPVQLIDPSGRVVYSDLLRNEKSLLDLGSLPGGTYQLIINNAYRQQLIIE